MVKSLFFPAVVIRSSYSAVDDGSGRVAEVIERWIVVISDDGFRVLRTVNMVWLVVRVFGNVNVRGLGWCVYGLRLVYCNGQEVSPSYM